MSSKLKRVGRFLLYVLCTNAIYGVILYFGFTWIDQFSYLLGYIWNLVMIAIGLALDRYSLKVLQTEKLVEQLKDEVDIEKTYRFIQLAVNNFVSFKTVLYIFYALILVVSPIIDFYPALFNENLASFIHSNSNSILFVVAFDMLVSQLSKDSKNREQMNENAERVKESLIAGRKQQSTEDILDTRNSK